MTSLSTLFHGFGQMIELPGWAMLLLKITAILSVAWGFHVLLSRRNPRWQVLLWRLTGLGLIALPIVTGILPAINIPVLTPPVEKAATQILPPSDHAPMEFAAHDRMDTRSASLSNPSPRISPDLFQPNTADSLAATPQTDIATPLPEKSRSFSLAISWMASWPHLLLSLWFVGMAFFAFRLILGQQCFLRKVHGNTAPPLWVQEECERVARAVGCHGQVDIALSDNVHTPLLCGFRRPTLLLPARMCDESYSGDLPGVFAHELTHVRCYDLFWNAGLQIVSIVLWFHPLVWRLCKAHLTACERICDAVSAHFLGDVDHYSRILARVAVQAYGPVPATGIAMARTSAIRGRLNALKNKVLHMPLRRRNAVGFGIVALLAMAVIGSLQFALAAPPTDKQENASTTEKAASAPSSQESTPPSEKSTKKADEKPIRIVEGVVVDANGRPASGISVKAFIHEKEEDPVVQSDAEGRFIFRISTQRSGLVLLASNSEKTLLAYHQLPEADELPAKASSPIQLTLNKPRSIEVTVADASGKPVPNAVVGAVLNYEGIDTAQSDSQGKCFLKIPGDQQLQSIFAFKSGLGLDYIAWPPKDMTTADDAKPQPEDGQQLKLSLTGAKTVKIKLLDPEDRPLAGINIYPWLFAKPETKEIRWNELNIAGVPAFYVKTNAEGVALFDWLPATNAYPITFWHRTAPDFVGKRIDVDYKSNSEEITAKLVRTVPLRGQVRHADGHPAKGIKVKASGHGYQLDGFYQSTTTDDDGKYEFRAYPNLLYMLVVDDFDWAAKEQVGIVVRPDTPIEGIDFQLQPAVEIHGQVTLGPDKKPVADQNMRLMQNGPDNCSPQIKEKLPNPTGSNTHIQANIAHWGKTDAQGNYAFHVGPGKYVLVGPSNTPVQKFEVKGQEPLVFDFNSPRPDRGIISGKVVLQGTEAKPAANAKVIGFTRTMQCHADLAATTDDQGRFRVERWLDPMLIHAVSQDGQWAGTTEITADDKDACITLQPTTTAEGRLLDATNEKPVANREIQYGVRVYELNEDGKPANCWCSRFGGTVTTDAEGRFKLSGLMMDAKYEFDVANEIEKNPPQGHSWQQVGEVTVKGTEPIALGDLHLKPPYQPPTLQERIAKVFESTDSLESRLETVTHDAKLTCQRVLIVYADPKSDACQQFYKLYFENEKVRNSLTDYRLIAVNAGGDKAEESAAWLKTHWDVKPADQKQLGLLIIDEDGKLLACESVEKVSKADAVNDDMLVEWLSQFTPERPDAKKLLIDALAQAERENKRVLVEETGVYCGWCIKLARYLDSQREILSQDYVMIQIDRSRFKNGDLVMRRLRTGKNDGIPWMTILNAQGEKLITADAPEGNIGYPSKPEEINYFLKMLESTAQRITPEQFATLRQGLEKSAPKSETKPAQTAKPAESVATAATEAIPATPAKEETPAATDATSPATPPKAEPAAKEEATPTAKTMRITVFDSEGKPLSEVDIHASFWTNEKDFKANRDYKTDAEGTVTVELPKTLDIFRLFVNKDGYVPLFQGWESNWLVSNRLPQRHVFKMEKGITIGGTVKNEEGKPIAGAKVTVSCKGGNCRELLAYGDEARTTDAAGRWTLDNVPSGDAIQLSVRFSHPDYLSDQLGINIQQEQNITLASLRNQTATAVMHRGLSIDGVITDPEGKPIADALVVRHINVCSVHGGSPLAGISEESKIGHTDANGHFQLKTLAPGQATLVAIAPGWVPQFREIDSKVDLSNQDFHMKSGKPLELRFVDVSGKPIPEVEVQIAAWQGKMWFANSKDLDTKIAQKADKNGVWRWDSAPMEPVKLEFYANNLATGKLEIAGGEPVKTITLKPEHRILARITDATTGKPIPKFNMIQIDVFRSNWLHAERANARSGKDGRISYLATRTDIPMRLRIEADGYLTQDGPEFQVGDDSPRLQDFKMQPSEPISGIVHDADDKPVVNAKVILATPSESAELDQPGDISSNHIAVTNAAGQFQFPATSEAFVVLVHADAGFAMLEGKAGQHDVGILHIAPWASIRGQFRDDGKPIKNANLYLRPVRANNTTQPRVYCNQGLQVVTDADGHFEFKRVPPLPVNVRVSIGPWCDEAYRSGPSMPLDLKPGQQVELDLGGAGAVVEGKVTLTGQVPPDLDCNYSLNYLIRREPGIALPPSIANAGFDIRKGWQDAWGKTEEGTLFRNTLQHWFVKLTPDGSFRISGVPAGEYDLALEVYAKPTGCLVHPLARKIVPVTVTAEDATRGTLTLPNIELPIVPWPSIGDTPAFSFERSEGGNGSLSDFHGKYTIVHFWASWCETCKRQLPALRQIQEQSVAQGLAVVDLSLAEDTDGWQDTVKNLNLVWPQGRLVGKELDIGVSSVPAYWLLDPSGKLIAKYDTPEKLADALKKIDEKPSK
jgi:beta-lactamase regulating signal transducer with metallopeptidase domain/uncharacterized GH25 family protein/thiol-disulfide isomerase/thioredoxin